MVRLDTSRLNFLIDNIDDNAQDFIDTVSFSIQREAQINAPVDTGALKNSIYAQTPKTHQSPNKQDYELPRAKKLTDYVGPSMRYAIYVEFGTNRQSAQPYFIPAVERVASQLNNHYRLILP